MKIKQIREIEVEAGDIVKWTSIHEDSDWIVAVVIGEGRTNKNAIALTIIDHRPTLWKDVSKVKPHVVHFDNGCDTVELLLKAKDVGMKFDRLIKEYNSKVE